MFSFKNLFSTKVQSNRPASVVGIDMGSSSIKVVEIEDRDGLLTLRTYGELQLGPYANMELGKAVQLTEKKKTEALVDVLREAGVESKDGVLAMPLSSSFVTIMSLVAKDNEDIEPRIRVEARKYIPIPLNEVMLDWSELPPLAKNPDNVREMLIVAVQNEVHGELLSVLRSVQKSVQPTEIEIFSTMRAVTNENDSSIAILDLGAQISKLYITHDGMLRKIHRARVGGTHATSRISELTGLSYEDAENAKRSIRSDQLYAEDIKKAVVSTFERPFQEFKRVIAQHEMKLGKPIERIVVSGGSGAYPELIPFANYMFDRTLEQANPFAKIAYPIFMEERLAEIAPSFTTAIGAALMPYQN